MLEGVFVDRTNQGLKSRFLKGEPPSDADVAHVAQMISRRVIRKPHCERFVHSIKEEVLDRMIFMGEASLRYAI